MNELIATYLPLAVLVIGIMAFVVSVIVEVTKNLPWLWRVPTDLYVLVLALVLSLLALFAYAAYVGLVITWYYIVAAIVTGFFVAFVAMYGWEKITELYNRFKQ